MERTAGTSRSPAPAASTARPCRSSHRAGPAAGRTSARGSPTCRSSGCSAKATCDSARSPSSCTPPALLGPTYSSDRRSQDSCALRTRTRPAPTVGRGTSTPMGSAEARTSARVTGCEAAVQLHTSIFKACELVPCDHVARAREERGHLQNCMQLVK